jgi:hypothetical protein
MKAVAVRLALIASLLLPGAQRVAPSEPFIVAVLQQTGLMIPVAQFDGAAWINKWPEGPPDGRPRTLPEIPQTWSGGVPFPTYWNLWPTGDGVRAVSIRGGTIVDTFCGSVWAVPTAYPPVARQQHEGCPIPIAGIAISTGRALLPMPKVGGQLVPVSGIAPSFEALETPRIDQGAADISTTDYRSRVRTEIVEMIDRNLAASRLPFTGHPLDAAERKKEAIKVKDAFQVVLDGISFTYVEAHREYPKPAGWHDAGCNSISAWRAWIRVDTKGVTTLLNPTLSATDCDMKGDEFVRPLGVVVTNGVPHVIAVLSGWESQDIGIISLTPTEVRLVVRGRAR